MGRHVTYHPPKREYRRRSRCIRGDGRPKFPFQTQEDAESAAESLRSRAKWRPEDIEVYECPACGCWHHGNRRLSLPNRNHRVVDRCPDLLVELGERSLTQMLVESSWKPHARVRAIAQRVLAVRRRPPASGSTEEASDG